MPCHEERRLQQQETETENLSRRQSLGTNQTAADTGGFDLWSQPQGPNLFSNWVSVCRTVLPELLHCTDRERDTDGETDRETEREEETGKGGYNSFKIHNSLPKPQELRTKTDVKFTQKFS